MGYRRGGNGVVDRQIEFKPMVYDSKSTFDILADGEYKGYRFFIIQCHNMFDVDRDGFSRCFGVADRNDLYEKLAREMGITKRACHFAKMDKPTLRKAIKVMEEWE